MELTSSSTSSGTQTPPPSNPSSTNTNGSLNLLRRHNTAAATPSTVMVSYKECLKNHAASLGGHALDGCCEFIPSLEPLSLTCAACECHRNFHRRQQFPNPTFISFYPISPSPGPSPSPPQSTYHYRYNSATHANGKKRHRTKFSEEQKEKMFEFCEKLGWRMPLPNDDDHPTVQDFCNTVGVSRRIFKVWMHNNKNRKKSSSST